jgi:hypothetical protein
MRPALGLIATGIIVPTSLFIAGFASATASAIPLGTASSFGILAGAGITNTGPTTINGDIGTFPTIAITGSGTMTINGVNHDGDAVTQQAKSDLLTAYANAAGQGPTTPITSDLGGLSLTPGVYNSPTTVSLTGTVTLDGGGNADSVFVFQVGSTLTTASASQVVLTNGTQACNVFWQVGSSATLGTGSAFIGTVLAAQSVTVTHDVTIGGRVLAQNGAVTLDTDVITPSTCAATAPTTTTTTPTTTTTASTPTTVATPITSPVTVPTTSPSAAAAAAKAAAAKAAAEAAAKAAAAKAAADAAAKAGAGNVASTSNDDPTATSKTTAAKTTSAKTTTATHASGTATSTGSTSTGSTSTGSTSTGSSATGSSSTGFAQPAVNSSGFAG